MNSSYFNKIKTALCRFWHWLGFNEETLANGTPHPQRPRLRQRLHWPQGLAKEPFFALGAFGGLLLLAWVLRFGQSFIDLDTGASLRLLLFAVACLGFTGVGLCFGALFRTAIPLRISEKITAIIISLAVILGILLYLGPYLKIPALVLNQLSNLEDPSRISYLLLFLSAMLLMASRRSSGLSAIPPVNRLHSYRFTPILANFIALLGLLLLLQLAEVALRNLARNSFTNILPQLAIALTAFLTYYWSAKRFGPYLETGLSLGLSKGLCWLIGLIWLLVKVPLLFSFNGWTYDHIFPVFAWLKGFAPLFNFSLLMALLSYYASPPRPAGDGYFTSAPDDGGADGEIGSPYGNNRQTEF